ncbi:MAG: SMC-Scp complex subunit ScpB [Clostridia bacterium]|nr:SMC-Scp complex subunit ScpB [Clostridia bacterium]
MNNKEIISALEAVLYASGDPISIDRLSQIFEIKPETVEKAADKLKGRLDNDKCGIELLRLDNAYQLATRKEFADYIKKAFDLKRRTPLSGAAFEVLSVIAYNQPVTRAFIEQVRGVDCSGVIATLLEKELIEEHGRLELPGRPLLYVTTKNFLRCFGLMDLSDLPPLPKDQNAVNDVGEQLPISEELNGKAAESEETAS